MIMEEYKVLITCSGVGNRLGNLTKYTNKSLVRIGKKPAISYIVERYPEDIELVITLGYFGNQVKDFLTLAYPNRKFQFVEVENFQGEGSSLLHSLLCARKHLEVPFIFHACDSIIEHDVIPLPDINWLGCVEDTRSEQYRTLNVNDGNVYSLGNKGSLYYDYVYIGVCGINDYELFWKTAEELYLANGNDSSLSDCDVINKIIKFNKIKKNIIFKPVIFNNWFDIGNVGSLKDARKDISDKFEILDKDDESIFIFNDNVIKFFSNSTIVKNRVARAYGLQDLVPKILGQAENFYKYKYVSGKLYSDSVNDVSFLSFLNWSKDNLWKSKEIENFDKLCFDFYITKTLSRINKFLTENNLNDNEQVINGLLIPKIHNIINDIDIKNLCQGLPVQFHGDYILDNIIETEEGFSLLDWRQDFAGQIECGDLYYDLGKLNHNLVVNHDIINRNLFKVVNHNDGSIECDILVNYKLVQCQYIFKDFVIKNNWDYNKVQILTSLIWLNMSALHHHPLNLFLFYFGKYNLYKHLQGSK
jgi:NDP-sugar pyrophosphorylase family protein